GDAQRFLSFPLHGRSPYDTPVVAILDNNPKRGVVRAFNGEEGSVDELCYPSNEDCAARGYKKLGGGIFNLSPILYNDQVSASGNDYLFYDGHTGYDYAFSGIGGRGIFPAAPGILVVATSRNSANGQDVWWNNKVVGVMPGGTATLQ